VVKAVVAAARTSRRAIVFLDSILTVKISDFAVGLGRLVEARLEVTNESSGEISVVSLESKEESGPVFTSYIMIDRATVGRQ
jgi:hypothetical protein